MIATRGALRLGSAHSASIEPVRASGWLGQRHAHRCLLRLSLKRPPELHERTGRAGTDNAIAAMLGEKKKATLRPPLCSTLIPPRRSAHAPSARVANPPSGAARHGY